MIEFRLLDETEEPTKEEFFKLEEHCEINLPQDFVRFYNHYDLPEDIEGEIYIKANDYPLTLQLDGFYLLGQMIKEYDVRLDEDKTIQSIGKLIPFAFDSSINQYCFFYSADNNNSPIIVWVDSNNSVKDLFQENKFNPEAVIVVRKTFKQFLEDLYIDNITT